MGRKNLCKQVLLKKRLSYPMRRYVVETDSGKYEVNANTYHLDDETQMASFEICFETGSEDISVASFFSVNSIYIADNLLPELAECFELRPEFAPPHSEKTPELQKTGESNP